MREFAKMYAKIVLFILIPILIAVTIGSFFINMIQNEAIAFIAAILLATLLGAPLIVYVHWLADRFF